MNEASKYLIVWLFVFQVALPGIVDAHASAKTEPVIYNISDPVAPGETVMLNGANLGEVLRLELRQEIAEQIVRRQVLPEEKSEEALFFVVPDDFNHAPFQCRLFSPSGIAEVVVNRKEIFWIQGDLGEEGSPGGWLRFFGKNFSANTVTVPMKVILESVDGEISTLEAQVTPFAGLVNIPQTLAAGSYRFSFAPYDGTGGDDNSTSIHISIPRKQPELQINVQDYGAFGDGQKDDTRAVQDALLKVAASGGGTVFFPRGMYRLSGSLSMPHYTRMRGEGRELSALCWSISGIPPEALVRGTSHFALEDLTLYADNHQHIIAGNLGDVADSGHVRLRRIRVRGNSYRSHQSPSDVDDRLRQALSYSTGGGDSIRAGGANIEITDSDIYGSGRALFLSRGRGSLIASNTFYNGRWGWYSISGSDGVVFEKNSIVGADLMATGGGINCLDGSSYSQNVYLAGNSFSLLHGWDREAMTTDAGGGYYYGKVISRDEVTLELSTEPMEQRRSWVGAGVFIVGGRGQGQYRRIVMREGRRIQLDRPWQVPPDETSNITITMFQGRYLVLDNDFTDTGPMQFYGTAVGSIVAGNHGKRMAGFFAKGLWYHGFQPSWYNLFLANRITEGNYYGWHTGVAAKIEVSGHAGAAADYSCRGQVVRGNYLENNSYITLRGRCRALLIEKNIIRDSAFGIVTESGVLGAVIKNNPMSGAEATRADEEVLAARYKEKYTAIINPNKPLAVWSFNGSADESFADTGEQRLYTEKVGDVDIVVEGRLGKAACFSGAGYLRVNDAAYFNMQDLSLTMWVKPKKITGRQGLVGKRLENVIAPFVVAQEGRNLHVGAAQVDGKWSYNTVVPNVFTDQVWVQLGVVFRRHRGVEIFIDGKKVFEKTIAALRATNTGPLVFGRDAWGGGLGGTSPAFFSGCMDEVKIWPRALSKREILQEYNN